MQEACQARLAEAGFGQYEVSAYAREGRQCAHNLNYWRFGDYLGIGAGAHGKLTDARGVRRRWKTRSPVAYLRHACTPKRVGGDEPISNARCQETARAVFDWRQSVGERRRVLDMRFGVTSSTWLIETYAERHNSRPGKEKALRRVRRRATL